MPTECNRDLFGYEVVEGRQVVAAFDGGEVTSDAGALRKKLLATWYLLDTSPYMVYGEVPLPNGQVQKMSEVAIPMTGTK